MVQLCRQHLLVGLPVVLGVCLHLSLAARAASWEDEPQQGRPKSDSDRETWGDFFSDLNILLRTLDLVWFLVAATIALALACWQPSQIVGDTSQVGSDGVKWTPPPWYALTTIFASLSSHAAGILGFVGFQKIVVARIVSTSQPRANWSTPNFLLLTSIGISITAIFSSLVFMGVDYLRRLAIDSARSRGYRLIVMRGKLERSGLGVALIMLTFVLIVLYMLVIYNETQNSKKQEASSDSAVHASRDMKVFLDKAYSCATVLLYFFNLRSLCESPKVQFHQILGGAGEDLGEISIKDYLKQFCDGRDEGWSSVRSCLACVANYLAGEDLGLFVKMGTRRALFPNQRLAPLLNVVGMVMLFGMLPGIFQFATEQLFVEPQILAVRAISADLLPAFDAESVRSNYVLLLGREPRLHVKTKSAQTSSIEICCETDPDNCTSYALEHSLIQFDETPAILKIPAAASTKCSLTARGLSKKSSTTLGLMVAVKAFKKVCDCHKNICSCCNGYQGELDAEGEEVQKALASDICTPAPCGIDNSNRKPGLDCNCSNGYFGDILWDGANVRGNCTPAPCYIQDSNRKPGPQCQCRDGFAGEVHWEGSEASGKCLPAACSIPYSAGTGKDCKCMDGYSGNISWNRSQHHGSCVPAGGCADMIANSTGEGLLCKCKDGFAGKVLWQGPVPQGSCQAAECRIENSSLQPGPSCRCKDGYKGDIKWNGDRVTGHCAPAPCAESIASSEGEGEQCKCKDGFTGNIRWHGSVPQGFCRAAECDIENSNMHPGLFCRCKDGYLGNITWQGDRASGACVPAPCMIPNSNHMPGQECACQDGYAGEVIWKGRTAQGRCTPAPCAQSIANSKGKGPQCMCKDGFTGNIEWNGSVPQGFCHAAECDIENSNMHPGLFCRCKDGYSGIISWHGDRAGGACEPAPCTIPNSNYKRGQQCACMDGFAGEVIWYGGRPQGRCTPATCANIAMTEGEGPSCRCKNGFNGTVVWSGAMATGECKPAACDVLNSNRKHGPACKCLDGFGGHIVWQGVRSYGVCSGLECMGSHSNAKSGPDCGCADAFNGSRKHVDVSRGEEKFSAFQVDCHPAQCSIEHSNQKPGPACACRDGYSGNITWNGPYESGECLPAPCNVPNSNSEPGVYCACKDGFFGWIWWEGHVAGGICMPAPCNIQNSNLEPGLACRCKDGFQGEITWNGASATGACEPVPCRILHSDHALGTACRCLKGFFGRIVWSGPTFSGTCVPRPLCRLGDAFHVTRLTAGLLDTNNNTCQAGQTMLVHGHTEWVGTKSRLRWTSANALPPVKCKVDWPEHARHAVQFNNPDPKHFSLTSWCATTPGLPLCSSQIVYTVTTRNTSQHACNACQTSEHALTEFRGSRCGYDLIQWESLTISPGSPDACTCNLSLSCSEVPAEELPRACIHFAEPAVLSESYSDEDDEEKDSDAFLNIFYETGELLMTMTSADFELADAFAAASSGHTWLSDGKNLRIRNPEESELWVGRAAGSQFFNNGSALHARGVLPEWWKVKFKQEAALPGSFNTDTLLGCEISFQSGNFCYSTRFGESVQVAPAQGEDCAFEDVTAADNRIAYEYKSSAFGVQTYRSSVTCYPTAAFEEILVQVVDVGMPAEDFNYTVASSPCRTTIRYLTDARSKLSECSFFR